MNKEGDRTVLYSTQSLFTILWFPCC